MICSLKHLRAAGFAALSLALLTTCAQAQERGSGGFLDNLFNRGQPSAHEQGAGANPQVAQADNSDVAMRLDRLESALRQVTGSIEQLQYQTQQLQQQLKRMQDDTEYRFQQLGSRGAPPAAAPGQREVSQPPQNLPPQTQPGMAAPPQDAGNGRRSDAFDPAAHPGAPGAPRTLGNETVRAPDDAAAPIGAPGGRAAGAPLNLSTLTDNPQTPPPAAPIPAAPAPGNRVPASNPGSGSPQLATLPPSASPQDEYDMAYGYVLHKDYALAEQAFRDFIRKYPNEHLVADAQYWLGESLFQSQHYRDAAEAFLAVSTKYKSSGKAAESLLRLGQSLAALKQKEAACATLAEVGRKYPRASASVKRSVTQEQKRAHC